MLTPSFLDEGERLSASDLNAQEIKSATALTSAQLVTLGSTLSGMSDSLSDLFTKEGTSTSLVPSVGAAPTIGGASSIDISGFSGIALPDRLEVVAIPELIVDAEPTLTAHEPTITTITAPARFSEKAPVAPPLADRVMPGAPGYVLPTVPTLRQLSLPTAPALLDVTFGGVLPSALPPAPSNQFAFTERDYQSMLSTALGAKLIDLVNNAAQSGLDPIIEQQLWDRSRERTGAVMRDAIDNVNRQFARSGWTMPQGEQVERIYKAQEQAQEAEITESRSIAIAQADLAQKNLQFAITQALALETQLINAHNQVEQRAFEAAKYVVESAINIWQAQVSMFNAGVTLYTAQAQVYRDRIQAELAKLEVYKTELEGLKLIGELNGQDIANYTAQIQAVVAIFGLYKDELGAVKLQLEGDGLKLQQFESQIKIYSELLHAKSLEYEGYKAELSGEELKAKIYDSIVGAYGKRVEAHNGITNARVKQLDANIKVNVEVPIKKIDQQLEAYKATIQAAATSISAQASAMQAGAAYASANASIYHAEVDLAIGTGKVAADQAIAAATNATANSAITISAATDAAKIQAQIIASENGKYHFNTSTSDTNTTSNSWHTSFGVSHSYPHKES